MDRPKYKIGDIIIWDYTDKIKAVIIAVSHDMYTYKFIKHTEGNKSTMTWNFRGLELGTFKVSLNNNYNRYWAELNE